MLVAQFTGNHVQQSIDIVDDVAPRQTVSGQAGSQGDPNPDLVVDDGSVVQIELSQPLLERNGSITEKGFPVLFPARYERFLIDPIQQLPLIAEVLVDQGLLDTEPACQLARISGETAFGEELHCAF